MGMLLIYTPNITSRHKYIFKLFFDEIFRIDFQITNNLDEFSAFNGAKLNYSNQQFADELFIESFGLLDEKGINQQEINVHLNEEFPVFFSSQSEGVLPFDVFSGSFI